MKNLLLALVATFMCVALNAQDDQMLVFEFMKVDNGSEMEYWEAENFWEKIHAERVKSGDIIGWDLWSLRPGGTEQGFQYFTVTIYKDGLTMLNDDVMEAAKNAYPDMKEEDLWKNIIKSGKSRDLAERLYVRGQAETDDEFSLQEGSNALLEFMKTDQDSWGDYVKAEKELFQPLHQKFVENGAIGHWSLMQIMFPYGTQMEATHFTVQFFKDNEAFINSWDKKGEVEVDEDTQQKMDEGIKTRDLVMSYYATMIKKVR